MYSVQYRNVKNTPQGQPRNLSCVSNKVGRSPVGTFCMVFSLFFFFFSFQGCKTDRQILPVFQTDPCPTLFPPSLSTVSRQRQIVTKVPPSPCQGFFSYTLAAVLVELALVHLLRDTAAQYSSSIVLTLNVIHPQNAAPRQLRVTCIYVYENSRWVDCIFTCVTF